MWPLDIVIKGFAGSGRVKSVRGSIDLSDENMVWVGVASANAVPMLGSSEFKSWGSLMASRTS